MNRKKQETLKQTDESELNFIGQVVKRSLHVLESTWDMTTLGAAMLTVACKSNAGLALYMISVINPKPNSLVTDTDVVSEFPMGFEGDWESTWKEFEKTDQRAAFRR